MIERGEATLVANLNLRGEAGARLVSESVQEMRYPTEYTPPQLPDHIPKEKATEFLKNWPHVGIVPTAFETRNVGETLELQADVSNDGQWISMNVIPQHVRFLRFAKFDAGILPSGERLSVEQPQFTTLKNTLSMHVRAGQRVLLGVHKIPEDENDMELFFLRVRAQKTGGDK
jgi:general secretion pathway protein D